MSLTGRSEGVSHAPLQTTNPNGQCLYDRTVSEKLENINFNKFTF